MRNEPDTTWDRTIDLTDVWETDALSYEAQRDAIVHRIRESGWLAEPDPINKLSPAVDQLARAVDYDEFETCWEQIEDHARDALVWIYCTEADIPRVSVAQAQTYIGRRVTVITASGNTETGTVTLVTARSRTLILVHDGGASTASIALGSIDSVHADGETT